MSASSGPHSCAEPSVEPVQLSSSSLFSGAVDAVFSAAPFVDFFVLFLGNQGWGPGIA